MAAFERPRRIIVTDHRHRARSQAANSATGGILFARAELLGDA